MAFGLNLPEVPKYFLVQNSLPVYEIPQEAQAVLASRLDGSSLMVNKAILADAEDEAKSVIKSNFSDTGKLRDLVLAEAVLGLKNLKNRNSSLLEYLVIGVMRTLDPFNMGRFYRGTTCLAEKSQFFPKGFPHRLRQKGESIVIGKIKDMIGADEMVDYLVSQSYKKTIRQIEKDIVFAKKQGIDAINFARLSLVLGQLSCAPSLRGNDLEQAIVEGMKGGELNIVHIKCLRFVYPREGGVRVLVDTSDIEIDGALGRYWPKSEERLFPRLLALKGVLERNGVKQVKLSVLVADEDIDLLYSKDNLYVSETARQEAKSNAQAYIEFLRLQYSSQVTIYSLNEYIAKNGLKDRYQARRKEVMDDLKRGLGQFVKQNFFEISRVNHQYEYYRQLIGHSYSRDEARRSSIEQMASTLAIEVVFAHFSRPMLVVEEDRGGENNLIGGGKFPIFFTRLRDQAIFQ